MIFVYKTTNNLNGKFYIGVHEGTVDDSYLGSGVHLLRAIAKYGRHNFYREIIRVCEDRKAAYILEKELVTPEVVDNKLCYNMNVGGHGGWYHIDCRGDKNPMANPETRKKVGLSNSRIRKFRPDLSNVARNNIKKAHAYNRGKKRDPEIGRKIGASLLGTKHTAVARANMGASRLGLKDTPEACENKRLAAIKRIADGTSKTWGDHARGKENSEETKKKKSDSRKKMLAENGVVKDTCVHCGFTGMKTNIKMWHNENCKHNPNKIESSNRPNTSTCKHCGFTGLKANITRWHNDNCKHTKLYNSATV